ncbi:OmpA/MotB domain protein [Hymenobacter roseosalivarius DSM 11622]|uniref:OmpA/MotB domain protein n=1 Tax=Hymenobacter roseosalivarius DSM 11622 TaxID=645990 RepID=A0A1W1V319_9BACT|nr:OmpA family protein [Hymenobacter roseosalivarius]SMB87698.1 OmpA/MotB domain protein [Hymenobacter roseosalivarius DSM 11622]
MTYNLLETVKNHFSTEAIQQTGVAAVGESEAGIERTLSRVISLVINSLTNLAEQVGGAEVLWSMAREAHDQGVLSPSAGRIIGGGGWQSRGAELMKSLLSDRYTFAVETIADGAGSQKATVSNLLGLATPITLAVLGQQAAEAGLDSSGLSQWLQEQRRMVGAIQPDMARPFAPQPQPQAQNQTQSIPRPSPMSFDTPRVNGLGYNPDKVGLQNRRTSAVGDYYHPEEVPVKTSIWSSSWLGLGILLVAIAAALGYFLGQDRIDASLNNLPGNSESEAAAQTTVVATGPAGTTQGRYDEATGNYIYDTGLPTLIKLRDGPRQMVGANSTENRLYQFLANDAAQVDSVNRTKGWISFDRIYFAPSSAVLTPESQQQLRNVAAILKNFPRAKVRIGGYTDNSGSFVSNMKMSEDRANAAMAVLVDLGVDATRVTTKGYGQKIPIASNDTEDGRALNRRISLRVTRK